MVLSVPSTRSFKNAILLKDPVDQNVKTSVSRLVGCPTDGQFWGTIDFLTDDDDAPPGNLGFMLEEWILWGGGGRMCPSPVQLFFLWI